MKLNQQISKVHVNMHQNLFSLYVEHIFKDSRGDMKLNTQSYQL
jgi:hypothetical protein